MKIEIEYKGGEKYMSIDGISTGRTYFFKKSRKITGTTAEYNQNGVFTFLEINGTYHYKQFSKHFQFEPLVRKKEKIMLQTRIDAIRAWVKQIKKEESFIGKQIFEVF